MGIGETLRRAREDLGLTIEEAAEKTRIRSRYLEALEMENFDGLPDDVYVKGFIRSYARLLGLDPKPLVSRYNEQYSRNEPELLESPPVKAQKRGRAGKRSHFLFFLAAGIILAAAGTYAFRGALFPPETPGPAPVVENKAPHISSGQSGVNPQPPPGPESPVQPDPQQKGVNLVLNVVRESCWMRVVVDGEVKFTGELTANQSRSFSGKERIEVKLGNAGAVRVLLNGRDLGYLGERGEVVDREFSAFNEG